MIAKFFKIFVSSSEECTADVSKFNFTLKNNQVQQSEVTFLDIRKIKIFCKIDRVIFHNFFSRHQDIQLTCLRSILVTKIIV